MLAAVQAPVIMMSQNRQDAKDRLRSELAFRVNQKAELEIEEVLQRVQPDRAKAARLTTPLTTNPGGPGAAHSAACPG